MILKERDPYSGNFELIIFNSHEVYELIHRLSLRKSGDNYTGTIINEEAYGFEPYKSSTREVSGCINPDTGILELVIHVPELYTGKLLLKQLPDGTYQGNFISYGDRWEKWEKK